MHDGIRATLAAGYHHLIVEGDSRDIIQAVRDHTHIPWQIQNLLQDVHNMLSPNVHCLFQHTYREDNMATGWIAKYGCVIRSSTIFYFSFPSCRDFISIRVDDNLGRTIVRRLSKFLVLTFSKTKKKEVLFILSFKLEIF